MTDKTINQLTTTTSAAAADLLPIWVTGSGVTRGITKANFMGGAMTGGGTVATGGFTLTVPATGTAALRGAANTFTAAQTFSSDISIAGALEFLNDASIFGNKTSIAASTIITYASMFSATGQDNGLLLVLDKSSAVAGLVYVRGGLNAVTSVVMQSGISVTKDTADSINVYYESGYQIQNTRTSARSVTFILIV